MNKTTPQLKNVGKCTFFSNGILNEKEMKPNTSTWLYKLSSPKEQGLLNYLKDKFPYLHKLAIEQWDYQGGVLGQKEIRLTQPLEEYENVKNKCLSFLLLITWGIIKNGHTFLNIQNKLLEVQDIPEEVEKKAYSS